jgi:DNA-binding response OmpR family regulator
VGNLSENREKILVVEDDAALAMGLVHNLKYEGFDVLLAPDGETGLKAACDGRPDLILLDVGMPKLDGFSVLRELRQAGFEMQVMMLTARGTDEDKVRGLGLGADDYITKPFSIRELIARVNSSLRRVRTARALADARPLLFGDVRVDVRSRTVTRDGVEKPLSVREFDLLVFLARNPGRAFQREELLRTVWGWDYDGTERTVDNFIHALRSELEPDPAHPRHFCTVFGVGYVFRP